MHATWLHVSSRFRRQWCIQESNQLLFSAKMLSNNDSQASSSRSNTCNWQRWRERSILLAYAHVAWNFLSMPKKQIKWGATTNARNQQKISDLSNCFCPEIWGTGNQCYLFKSLRSSIVRIWHFRVIVLLAIWAHQFNLHHQNQIKFNLQSHSAMPVPRLFNFLALTFLWASWGRFSLNLQRSSALKISSAKTKKHY